MTNEHINHSIHGIDHERTGELGPSKETWQANFGVITISGDSGAGKTTLANSLAQIYGIPSERNIKIGKKVRKITGNEKGEGFMEREVSVDESVDEEQRIIMSQADVSHPYILESRLGGVIASEVKQKSPQLPIISIMLKASPDIAVKRIHLRRREMTKDEIIGKEKERAENDLKLWKTVHPEMADPYDRKYFNLVINTDSMTNDEVLTALHRWLVDNHYVIKQENKTNNKPGEHQIFPTPSL